MEFNEFFNEFKNLNELTFSSTQGTAVLDFSSELKYIFAFYPPSINIRKTVALFQYSKEISISIYSTGYVIIVQKIVPNKIIDFKLNEMTTLSDFFNLNLIQDLYGMDMEFIEKCRNVYNYLCTEYFNSPEKFK